MKETSNPYMVDALDRNRRSILKATMMVLSLCSHFSNAYAQSSVTLYGLLDNGITYSSNQGGHSRFFMQDGIESADRLGFQGAEDLGSGKKAIFRLENGFTASNGAFGQGGLMFGRQAYIGLSDNSWGTLTLGRQYDFQINLLDYIPCSNCGVYSVANADIDRIAGERLNNSIKYESPNRRGFHFGAMYSISTGSAPATNASAGAAYSLLADYKYRDFGMGAAVTSIRDVSISPAAIGLKSIFGQSLAANPALLMNRQRIIGTGASYSPGNFRFTATYSNTQLQYKSSQGTVQIGRAGIQYLLHTSLVLQTGISKTWFQGRNGHKLASAATIFCLNGPTFILKASSSTRTASMRNRLCT
jgi:outer membrane protein OmpU